MGDVGEGRARNVENKLNTILMQTKRNWVHVNSSSHGLEM
jgi:hypothetical protein